MNKIIFPNIYNLEFATRFDYFEQWDEIEPFSVLFSPIVNLPDDYH